MTDLPWQRPELKSWRIAGMNHYRQNGAVLLFVAMTKDHLLIQAEGPDGPLLWEQLAQQANLCRSPGAKIMQLQEKIERARRAISPLPSLSGPPSLEMPNYQARAVAALKILDEHE